jgi:hypothetical protein
MCLLCHLSFTAKLLLQSLHREREVRERRDREEREREERERE